MEYSAAAVTLLEESVPNDALVSRGLLENPWPLQKIKDSFNTRSNYCLSVYWRKYAVSARSVHVRGLLLARIKTPPRKYHGFVTLSVANVVAIHVENFKFVIKHHPNDNVKDMAHCHIQIVDDIESKPPTDRLLPNTRRLLLDEGLAPMLMIVIPPEFTAYTPQDRTTK